MSSPASIEITYAFMTAASKLCHDYGVRYAVLSPGSRSAPVALPFLRNGNITSFIIPDERSAAYTALGIAQSRNQPVALICTSGTASLNYAPAVAEAYFAGIPLLILTADRPPEWVGQADNQSIHQQNIYTANSKGFFELPVSLDHSDSIWQAGRIFNEALNLCTHEKPGPVHINIPQREPLYINSGVEALRFEIKPSKVVIPETSIPESVFSDLKRFKRIALLAGSHSPDTALFNAIEAISGKIAFFPDITSNLINVKDAITNFDLITELDEFASNSPDLLITIGGPIVSKKLRQLFRENILEHWNVGLHLNPPDTFKKLSKVILTNPVEFLNKLTQFDITSDSKWLSALKSYNYRIHEYLTKISFPGFTELSAFRIITEQLPGKSVLHLGNSLPVRYGSIIPPVAKNLSIYSNRGTSGIDGCVSTAVGHSMIDDRIQTLIVGDLSFMYDRNGLWNNYIKKNLKIIIFNNHGGGIFRVIPGPSEQPEVENYFATEQPLNFEETAKQHSFKYLFGNDTASLSGLLNEMYSASGPVILELEFEKTPDLKNFKKALREYLHT